MNSYRLTRSATQSPGKSGRNFGLGVWDVADFSSHSSADNRTAVALKQWLAQEDTPLANEIFLDTDPDTG